MEADVVVIGGGGSGLAAAVSAAEHGARVLLLEKNATLGGTTAMSVGVVTSSRTPAQRRAGIVDDPDAHYADMALFSKQYTSRSDNDELRRVLAHNLPETVQWLVAHGVEFYGPTPEAPHRQPRMHNALPGSRAYIYCLERKAEKTGVEIVRNARAKRLVRDGGRVSAVEFEAPDGAETTARAARGVILASGDYSADPGLKGELISQVVADTPAVNPANTGDGQRMALALGARILNGDMFLGGIRFVRPVHPSWISRVPPFTPLMRLTGFALRHTPTALVRRFVMGFLTSVLVPSRELFESGAILVNRAGGRFTDETKMTLGLARQPEGVAYIVMDGALAEKFSKPPHEVSTAPGFAYAYLGDYERSRRDIFHKADTPEALARSMGVDPERFAATIRDYNEDVRDGAGAAPSRGQRPPLRLKPFVALGPVRDYINFTDGGLAVNERLEVLDAEGAPIPGLYAAGSTGQGGLLLKGHGHHLGWAFTSGKLAGRHAAQAASAVPRIAAGRPA